MNHYENKEAKKYLAAAVIVAVFAAAVVGMVMFARRTSAEAGKCGVLCSFGRGAKDEPADRWKTIDAYFKSCGELQGDGFCSVKAAVWFDRARAGFAGIGTSPDRSDVFCNSDSDCRRRAADWDFFFLSDETEKEDRGIDPIIWNESHMGHYDLDLSVNSEDELSNLKNQLI